MSVGATRSGLHRLHIHQELTSPKPLERKHSTLPVCAWSKLSGAAIFAAQVINGNGPSSCWRSCQRRSRSVVDGVRSWLWDLKNHLRCFGCHDPQYSESEASCVEGIHVTGRTQRAPSHHPEGFAGGCPDGGWGWSKMVEPCSHLLGARP